MKNAIYQLVFNGHTDYLSLKEIKEKYTITGYNFNHRQRDELQGSPRLKGFLGAMWGGYKDGKPVLRYETSEVCNILSK